MRSVLMLLALTTPLAACDSTDTPSPTGDGPRPFGSITLTWTQRQGPIDYIDGAVADFVLESADGTRFEPEVRHNQPRRWRTLRPGTYTLTAGLRPCSSSCDDSDPLRDTCAAHLDIDDATDVKVHVRL